MFRVIVDPVTQVRLAQARNTLELCDNLGHVLGHFVPILDHQEGAMEPQITVEELDRRGGRPLAEVLADLEKRS